MKSFNRLLTVVIFLFVLGLAIANIMMLKDTGNETGRPYMVEIERLVQEMNDAAEALTIEDITAQIRGGNYQYLKAVVLCETDTQLTEHTKYDTCVRQVGGQIYRFEYSANRGIDKKQMILINGILLLMSAFSILTLLYVRTRILLPFQRLEQVPYDLSKGKLSVPLEERSTKYFGRFIWGTNMLREHLDEQRQKELNMHRDKKLLLLSLTHDIKTPLSVIKLNAQALNKGLYKDEERQKKAAGDIVEKVDEIEQYVSQIIDASREDFLDLSVQMGEAYLKDVVQKLAEYNKIRLDASKTEFVIGEYENCLLSCDEARLSEVLQNLMENALKYGDGKRIDLTVSREEDCALICVSNTGSQLSKDEIGKIFDSFFRGSNVGEKAGSGLGLYICRKLMHNMNGDIFAKQSGDVFSVTVVVPMV